MASIDTSVLDAALEEIKTAERIVICSSEPTTYSEAIATILLENSSPVHGDIEDYTDGRQFTTEAISSVTASSSGTATYYAYINDTNSLLLAVQTLSASITIASGSSYDISTVTIQNPAVT
jgi:hypothetical protein